MYMYTYFQTWDVSMQNVVAEDSTIVHVLAQLAGNTRKQVQSIVQHVIGQILIVQKQNLDCKHTHLGCSIINTQNETTKLQTAMSKQKSRCFKSLVEWQCGISCFNKPPNAKDNIY